jgi:hypothetical protein
LTAEEYQDISAGGKTTTVYRDNIDIFEGIPTSFKARVPPQGTGVDFDFTIDPDPVEGHRSTSTPQDCIEVEIEPQLKRKGKRSRSKKETRI